MKFQFLECNYEKFQIPKNLHNGEIKKKHEHCFALEKKADVGSSDGVTKK